MNVLITEMDGEIPRRQQWSLMEEEDLIFSILHSDIILYIEIISELNFLEHTGIDILYKSKVHKNFFLLGLMLGDNLGLHSILGFTESFMANSPCRFCRSIKFECHP